MVERTIISRPVLLHPWQFFEDLETFIPKIASIYLFWMSNLGFTTEKTKNLSTQHVNLRCPNCLVNLKVTSCLSLNGVFMPGRGTDGLHLFQKNNLRESNKTLVFFKSKNAISWWQLAVRVCVYNIYIYLLYYNHPYMICGLHTFYEPFRQMTRCTPSAYRIRRCAQRSPGKDTSIDATNLKNVQFTTKKTLKKESVKRQQTQTKNSCEQQFACCFLLILLSKNVFWKKKGSSLKRPFPPPPHQLLASHFAISHLHCFNLRLSHLRGSFRCFSFRYLVGDFRCCCRFRFRCSGSFGGFGGLGLKKDEGATMGRDGATPHAGCNHHHQDDKKTCLGYRDLTRDLHFPQSWVGW